MRNVKKLSNLGCGGPPPWTNRGRKLRAALPLMNLAALAAENVAVRDLDAVNVQGKFAGRHLLLSISPLSYLVHKFIQKFRTMIGL